MAGCPELQCLDLQRMAADEIPVPDIFRLDALSRRTIDFSGSDSFKGRPYRRQSLYSLLGCYALSGPAENRVELAEMLKQAAERLGSYGEQAGRHHPEFMAVYALSHLDPTNWWKTSVIGSGGEPVDTWEYVSPPQKMEHLDLLRTADLRSITDQAMQIDLLEAVEDQYRSSPNFASHAMDWALQPAPPGDDDGEDARRRHLARTTAAAVAIRDGDEDIRVRHRELARGAFLEASAAERYTRLVPILRPRFSPVAMAFVGIVCMLREDVEPADVRTL